MVDRIRDAAGTGMTIAKQGLETAAEEVGAQVKAVKDLYVEKGFTGVGVQVVKTHLVGKAAAILGPFVLAMGLGKGVHGELTKSSPLSEAALPLAGGLIAHLEAGDTEGAKKMVEDLFRVAPKTTRKDLASHLHAEGYIVSAYIARRLDQFKNEEQSFWDRWKGRIFGDSPEARVQSVCLMIDELAAELERTKSNQNSLKTPSEGSPQTRT